MSNLFKKMANIGGRGPVVSSQPVINLAVFGKHPGWDDHIPGIGLETEVLAHLKQTFYVSGIGGQIDSGVWEKLEAGKRLEGFDHTFLWLREGHVLLGCLWSSTDRKGRTKYPMVLCVDSQGISPHWLLIQAGRELAHLRDRCRAVTTSLDVEAASQNSQGRLRTELINSGAAGVADQLPLEARRQFVDNPRFGEQQVGLLRILHELGDVRQAATAGKRPVAGGGARSRLLRVPAIGRQPDEIIRLWLAFLQAVLPGNVPLMLIYRPGTEWLDLIVGEPDGQDFFCLQASTRALPFSNEIPYELKPELHARWPQIKASLLGDGSNPATVNKTLPGALPETSPVTVAGATRKLPWMLILGLVIALLGAVWIICRPRQATLASGSGENQTASTVSPGPAPAPTAVPAPAPPPAPTTSPVVANEPARQETPPQAASIDQQKLDALLQQARADLEGQNYAEAVAQARAVLALNPTNDAAAGLLKTAQDDLAAQALAQTQEVKLEATLKQAQTALAGQDYTSAVAQAQAALAINPTNFAAATLLKTAQDNLAAQASAQALDVKLETALKQAQVALDGQDYTTAVAQVQAVLAINPTNAAAAILLKSAQDKLAGLLRQQQQENSYQTTLLQAQAALNGKDYSNALALADAALAIKPNDAVVLALQRQARAKLDEKAAAQSVADQYQAAMQAGLKAFVAKDYSNALTQASAALSFQPGDQSAQDLKNQAQRLLDAQIAAQQQQEKFDRLLAAAQAAFDQKDYQSAQTQARAALDLQPESNSAQSLLNKVSAEGNYQSALAAGQAALQRKDFDEAGKQAAVALAIHPDGAEAASLKAAATQTDDQSQVKSLLEKQNYVAAFTLCNQHGDGPDYNTLRTAINQAIDDKLELFEVWYGVVKPDQAKSANARKAQSLLGGDIDLEVINKQIAYWKQLKTQLDTLHQLDPDRSARIDRLINKMD